jgi:integrase
VRQNPLYPSVRGSDKRDLPLADLRKSLEDPGKDPVSVERSARAVARIWADSLLPQEQGVAYEFYSNALLTWLPNKSRNTRRSYAGTLVQFFDFVSRSRSGGGDTLKLVAPHQLRQSDIDGFVAHLTRPSIHPETVIRDKAERLLFEWLQDYFNKNGGAKTDSNKVRDGLKAEGLMDIVSEYHAPLGFKAATSKGYDSFDLAISALARKRLVRRVPVEAAQLVAATPPKEGEMHPLYGLLPARVESANRAATQIQRVRALSSFWSHLLTDKKLGMSRRPGALEPINPWVEAGSTVKAGTGEDAIRKAQRKMSVEDLTNVIRKLGSERMASAGKFMTVSSILAVRDELAVFFFVSTGLRRSEGLMALVQNLKEPAGLLALDPGRELMILGGIRRKGKRQDEEVFVPRKILDLRAHMFGMMRQFVDEHDEVVASIRAAAKQQGDDGEKSADMAIARRETFRKSFQAVLLNANQGPLVPALGRWGNAVVKATDKARADKIALPQGDLSQVPMDGRNLLHRMQLLVAGKEERRLKYHPHSLRHLSVTMAEGIGEGSALGQAIAGHRSATTTEIYRDMVSLQAAAVLKVSRRLTDIFMKVEQGLQLAKAPAGAAEMPPVAEQPVAPEAPVEVAPSPEPVVLEPVETEAQKAIREAQESFSETLAKSGNPIQSRLSQVNDELAKKIGQNFKTKEVVLDSQEVPAFKNAALVASETPGIRESPEVLLIKVDEPITGIGPGTRAPADSPPQAPAQVGRGPKPLNLPKGVQKAKGREEKVEAMVNAALDSVPPGQWFLDAGAWQRNGEWTPVVFMSKEQVEATLSSGYMFGPQVVSRYGLTKSPKHDKLNIVMSMRTYLPYIYYATRATESPGEGTNDPVIQNFDNEMADIEPIPKQLNPNAARKKKPADQPSDEPKKEKRKIKVFPERLIYLPILNLSNQALVERFTEVLDHHYDDGKGGGLRVREPDQAKAMVRWLCILFSASRRVQREMGDTVSWIGSHDILPKIGETTSEAFNRTRAKVFREPEPDMLVSFLLREGIRIYGLLGSNFRVDDEKGRRSMVETRLANVLNDASDYQQGDVASFLSVYKLPDWIDSEDPIGGDKGLKPEELARLKQWLRTVGAKITSTIEFSDQAEKIEQFWSLIEPFAGSDARTINVPPDMAKLERQFNRLNQVDLLLGVRRCLRHMWEIREQNASAFESRGVVKLDKINTIWGLYWSWILPSPAEAKERLRQAGTALTKDAVKNIIEVMMMETSSKVILQRFQEVFDKFTALAQKHINNTALDKRKAAAMIESEAAKMAKDIADILFKGDVATDSAKNTTLRALEKYDAMLVESGLEGATAKSVKAARKSSKDLAEKFTFAPGKVSNEDLKDIYASGTSKLAATVTSSAILLTMASALRIKGLSAESLQFKEDDGSQAPEVDKDAPLADKGKVTQDISNYDDKLQSAYLEMIASLTKAQALDPRVAALDKEAQAVIAKYQRMVNLRDNEETLDKFALSKMVPIARKMRDLARIMAKESPPVALPPAPPPPADLPASPTQPSGFKRRVVSGALPTTKAVVEPPPPPPPPPAPVQKKAPSGDADLFSETVDPIEPDDTRWMDYVDEPGRLMELVEGERIEMREAMPRQERLKLLKVVDRLLSPARAKLAATTKRTPEFNALALGLLWRYRDLTAYYRVQAQMKKNGLTPNRDATLDTMSADLLATPQVMLVQQIKLRIPLLLAVIFS